MKLVYSVVMSSFIIFRSYLDRLVFPVGLGFLSTALVFILTTWPVRAASVAGWRQDAGTISSQLITDDPIFGTGAASSANNQAISSSIGTCTLSQVGDAVRLTGQVTLSGITVTTTTAGQLRWGMFNTNGSTTLTGWLGYLANCSSGTTAGALNKRPLGNTTSWLLVTGTTALASVKATNNAFLVDGTYIFNLQVQLVAANQVTVTWSLISLDGSYSLSGSVTDSSPSTVSFNRVGLFAASLTASKVTFTGLSFYNATTQVSSLMSWQADVGSNSSNLTTDHPTIGTGATNSVNGQALSCPISECALERVGDSVRVTGQVTFSGLTAVATTAGQFRWGVFNSNYSSVTTGWLGYLANDASGGTAGALNEKITANTDTWYTTGNTTIDGTITASNSALLIDGVYNLSLQIQLMADNQLRVTWSLIRPDGSYTLSGSYMDSSVTTFTFDRVGIFVGSLNASSITFSGMQVASVEVIPPGVTGWTVDVGTASSALTTSSPVFGTGASNSARSQAISSPIGYYTLERVGDSLVMGGRVTFTGLTGVSGAAGQFRWGLFGSNGSTGNTGWIGYLANCGSGTTAGALNERGSTNTTGWWGSSGTGVSAPATTTVSGGALLVDGTYEFRLAVELLDAKQILVNWSLIKTDGSYVLSGSYTDASPATFTYDRVGFFAASLSNAKYINFSGVTVDFQRPPLCISGIDLPLIVSDKGSRSIRAKITPPATGVASVTATLQRYQGPGLIDSTISATTTVTLSSRAGEENVLIPLTVPEWGIYQVTVSVVNAQSQTLASAVSMFASVPPRTAVGPSEFGTCTHFATGSVPIAELDLIKLAGISRVRDNFWWSTIEKTAGTYSFPSYLDTFVDGAVGRGINVLGILAGTSAAYPAPNGFPDTEALRTAFANFSAQCATRYAGRVDNWEIWNEPSSSLSTNTYAPLLIATYPAIRAANTNSYVISCGGGGAGGGPSGDFEGGVISGGGLNYQNAFSIHPYMSASPDVGYAATGSVIPRVSLPVVWPYLASYCAQTAHIPSNGTPLKVWVTEIGWSTYSSGADELTQAAYYARTYLLARRYGQGTINAIYWYDFRDDGVDSSELEHNFGLVRNDFSPKPSYVSASILTWILGSRTFTQALIENDNEKVFQYSSGTDVVYAAWSVGTAAHAVTFALPSGTYTLRDWQGHASTITSTGSYTITVTTCPQYITK